MQGIAPIIMLVVGLSIIVFCLFITFRQKKPIAKKQQKTDIQSDTQTKTAQRISVIAGEDKNTKKQKLVKFSKSGDALHSSVSDVMKNFGMDFKPGTRSKDSAASAAGT